MTIIAHDMNFILYSHRFKITIESSYFHKIYLNVKSLDGTILGLKHNNYKTTGWIFADKSIFTANDFENIN